MLAWDGICATVIDPDKELASAVLPPELFLWLSWVSLRSVVLVRKESCENRLEQAAARRACDERLWIARQEEDPGMFSCAESWRMRWLEERPERNAASDSAGWDGSIFGRLSRWHCLKLPLLSLDRVEGGLCADVRLWSSSTAPPPVLRAVNFHVLSKGRN